MQVDEAYSSAAGLDFALPQSSYLVQNLIDPFSAAREEERRETTSLSAFFFNDLAQEKAASKSGAAQSSAGFDLFELAEKSITAGAA
mmetsp:Transcript_10834/g.13653  ORF Transcript_10834/g.13653 Transcript_10834/m.13653 type:complete len:87 (-) Transcript_10834:967-1227(-)